MKVRFVLILIAFTSIINSIHAQSPDWLWAKGTGGTNYNTGTDVCEDSFGNVYMSGNFQSLTLTLGATTLTNSGLSDIFIVKYDANGNELWAVKVGNTDQDIAHSIAADAMGNIIITGVFYSSTLTFGNYTLVNSGTRDLFVAKLDSNGVFLWAKNALGFNFDFGYDITVDNGGNIYVTGEFNSGTIVFDSYLLNNAGGEDVFIAKYDTDGNVLWAKRAGGAGSDAGFGLSVDHSGNVFMTGQFYSSSITFDTVNLTNTGDRDYFIVKYDSVGTVQWAVSGDGTGSDYGYRVCNDSLGNVFVTGGFGSSSLVVGSTVLTSNGFDDSFIIKYDSNGNVVWANSIGGTNADVGTGIDINNQGLVFVTGRFSSPVVYVGVDSLFNLTPLLAEAFIVCFDSVGLPLWAKSINGTLVENITGIFCNNDGYVYISGGFQSTEISLGSTTLLNPNGNDGFIAKLDNVIISGLNDLMQTNGFVISPNPFSTYTTIYFTEEVMNCSLKIIDMLGNTLRTTIFNGNQYVIEKELLKPGIYFIQIASQNKNTSFQKCVVQ